MTLQEVQFCVDFLKATETDVLLNQSQQLLAGRTNCSTIVSIWAFERIQQHAAIAALQQSLKPEAPPATPPPEPPATT